MPRLEAGNKQLPGKTDGNFTLNRLVKTPSENTICTQTVGAVEMEQVMDQTNQGLNSSDSLFGDNSINQAAFTNLNLSDKLDEGNPNKSVEDSDRRSDREKQERYKLPPLQKKEESSFDRKKSTGPNPDKVIQLTENSKARMMRLEGNDIYDYHHVLLFGVSCG